MLGLYFALTQLFISNASVFLHQFRGSETEVKVYLASNTEIDK